MPDLYCIFNLSRASFISFIWCDCDARGAPAKILPRATNWSGPALAVKRLLLSCLI